MTRRERPDRGDLVGWCPDPTGRFPQRYRLRSGWTQRVRVGSAEAVDPVEVPASDPEEGSGEPSVAAADAGAGASPGRPWEAASGDDGEWREDPTGRFEQRWFDGRRLTRRVCHGGAVATDTVSPSQRTGRRRRWRGDGSRHRAGPGWRPDPDGEGERFHDGHDWTAKWRPAGGEGRSRRPGSPWAWLPRSVMIGLGLVAAVVLVLLVVVV